MRSERKFDIFLVIVFLLFSWWLMDKSFGYNSSTHQMRIARHQVGDFGLHLSLIRSFSWGNNFPPESPFFPGRPLPYHYYFDLAVGLLERLGIRIDIALNGISVVAFSILLLLIYKLPQIIFKKSRFIGLLSVLLFIFHSNLTFIDFFKDKPFSLSLLKDLWYLPDYLHKGPFDGSLISIFFTLNVYLNQRHLIAALTIGLAIFYFLLPALMKGKQVSTKMLILLGALVGLSSRIHTLIFFSNIVIFTVLFIAFKRWRWILPFFLPVVLFSWSHMISIFMQNTNIISHSFFNPGFLSERPFTVIRFISYWILNLGGALIIIPFGVFLAKPKQRVIFLSFFVLFIVANTFQLSFRIDHNHSLLNYFFIIANFYIAYFLLQLWQSHILGKVGTIVLFFFLTISGFIDLMAVKNDFRYPMKDAPTNAFMQWIKDNTERNAIFLSRQEILDPITLSGRRNYFGAIYYLSVMGYDFSERERLTKTFFETEDKNVLMKMKREGIDFIVIPIKQIVDFPYRVNKSFFDQNLQTVYKDVDVFVYRL